MLSSALMAVLITASPAHRPESAGPVAQVNSVCSAQFDRKFVHFVEKTPSEKHGPGLRLVAGGSKAMPLVTADGSNCVRELTRGDLVR
jgi:hypothetical protein